MKKNLTLVFILAILSVAMFVAGFALIAGPQISRRGADISMYNYGLAVFCFGYAIFAATQLKSLIKTLN